MKFSWFHPGTILALIRLIALLSFLLIMVSIGLLLKLLGLFHPSLRIKLRVYSSKMVLFILGIELEVTGTPDQSKGILYVCNHRTLSDGIIILSLLPGGRLVSKSEIRSYPLISTGAELAGVIYLERNSKDNRKVVKDAIIDSLIKKNSIIVFPEGTISLHKNILNYKKGSFEAAQEAKTFVQAIALEFMNPDRDFWLHSNLLHQYFVTFSQWKIKVKVHFFDKVIVDNAIIACQQIYENTLNKVADFQKSWNNLNYFS